MRGGLAAAARKWAAAAYALPREKAIRKDTAMLNFILGPSGSGKSYQMLAELRARAERGERSILIVPEQFTSSTEGQLYRTQGDSLSA